MNKRASAGVDGVSARAYGTELEGNLARLVGRLRRGSYRAKLVRRKEIPKSGGRTRPLGIPAVEDKLVQNGGVEDSSGDLGTGLPAVQLRIPARPECP